jgi:hypothetical protein
MSSFKPALDEREILKKAVSRSAHDPVKSQLLARLDLEDQEYALHSDDWNHLKFCVEQYHLHVQTEVRRDPNKKPTKLLLGKVDMLVRKFHPNFS